MLTVTLNELLRVIQNVSVNQRNKLLTLRYKTSNTRQVWKTLINPHNKPQVKGMSHQLQRIIFILLHFFKDEPNTAQVK